MEQPEFESEATWITHREQTGQLQVLCCHIELKYMLYKKHTLQPWQEI